MSFDKLTTIILSEAKAEAARRKTVLDERQKALQEIIISKASDIEKKIIGDAEKMAEREERRLRQQTKLVGKTNVLRAKEEELSATAEEFKAKILAWDKASVEPLLAGLVQQVPASKEGMITAGEAHLDILKPLAKKLSIVVSEKTLPNEGGFIYTSPEVEINFTISNIVNRLFSKHRAEISKALFA